MTRWNKQMVLVGDKFQMLLSKWKSDALDKDNRDGVPRHGQKDIGDEPQVVWEGLIWDVRETKVKVVNIWLQHNWKLTSTEMGSLWI